MPKVPRSTTYPENVVNKPEAKAEYDLFRKICDSKRAAPKVRGAKKARAVGPALYSADTRISNWSKTGAEWTQVSVTGQTWEKNDSGGSNYNGLHIAGMRVHAQRDEIYITDGSVPMQYYFDNISNYDGNSTSISFKYAAQWYLSVADGNQGITRIVSSILQQDANNTATKVRLDFYKDFSGYNDYTDTELAVQVIIENLDQNGYIETNVRYNLTDAQIYVINEESGTGSTYVELDLNRMDYRQTVALYDGVQMYDWDNLDSFYANVYDDELSSNLWLRGYDFTRRVPYTALQASAFFFPAAASVTNNVLGATNVATTDVINTNNKQNAWILALYIIVAILSLFVVGTTITLTWARSKRA